ncbi:hypothetical protein ACWEO1_22570 [Kitasatospora cineracea]
MGRVYATPEQYQTFTGEQPDADTPRLLADASRFLDAQVFRLAVYAADQATGMPLDPLLLQAFADATCAQVQWWDQLGDSIGAAGAGWGTVKIGSVHLQRSVVDVSGMNAPSRQVAPAVWDVLNSPDLVDRFRIGQSGVWW